MDSLLTSNDLSAKGVGLSGLLSSLNALLGVNSETSGLFASFLQGQQAGGTVHASATNTQGSTPQSTSDASGASSPNLALPSAGSPFLGGGKALKLIRSLVSELHHIILKLKNSKTQTQPQAGDASNANNGSNAPSANNAVVPVAAGNASTGSASDTSSGDDNSGSTDTLDPTNTKTLTMLLAELLQLMQMMEKRLEAAVSANNGTAGTSSIATSPAGNDNTGSTSQADAAGQTGAADPLTQLLTLLQQIQQNLGAAVGGSSTTQTTDTPVAGTTSATDFNPTASALDTLAQIQKDLKTLMDSLNTNPANNNAASGDGTNAPAPGVAGILNVSASAANSGSSAAPPEKPAWANGDFLNLFGNASGSTSSIAPLTFSTAGLITAGKNDVSSDSGSSGGNASFATNDSSTDTSSATNSGIGLTGFIDTAKSSDPYAFASQLSAARAANGGTAGLPDAVEQVLLQINRGVKDGNDQLTIQLQPAELGKVNIKLDISSDGKVQGTVTADNPSTLNLLLKDVRGLERALQEAGLRADPGSLQFSLGGQSGNTSGQMPGNFGPSTSSGSSGSLTSGATSLDMPADTAETYYVTPGRVNFKV